MEEPKSTQPFWWVILKARPGVAHPHYFDLEFGRLIVWLYAETSEQAHQHAREIVAHLPYEVVGDLARIYQGPTDGSTELGQFELAARHIGFGLFFDAAPVGTDEGKFAQADP